MGTREGPTNDTEWLLNFQNRTTCRRFTSLTSFPDQIKRQVNDATGATQYHSKSHRNQLTINGLIFEEERRVEKIEVESEDDGISW